MSKVLNYFNKWGKLHNNKLRKRQQLELIYILHIHIGIHISTSLTSTLYPILWFLIHSYEVQLWDALSKSNIETYLCGQGFEFKPLLWTTSNHPVVASHQLLLYTKLFDCMQHHFLQSQIYHLFITMAHWSLLTELISIH